MKLQGGSNVRTPTSSLKVYHIWCDRKSRRSTYQGTTTEIGKFFNHGKGQMAQEGTRFSYANEIMMGNEGSGGYCFWY